LANRKERVMNRHNKRLTTRGSVSCYGVSAGRIALAGSACEKWHV